MEVQFVPKTTLPSSTQSPSQPVPANSADGNAATRPILGQSAQAVTVSAEVETPEGERRQDRVTDQGERSVSPQQVLDSLRLTNRRTHLDFNQELDIVVLQVVDTRTDEIVETIPSEELVLQLRREAGLPQDRAAGNNDGGFVDQSI
jgi:uncharacterized FlaG/YvyC family protein